MSREIMCAYGNCEQRMSAGAPLKLTVTLTLHGQLSDRQSFCSVGHAVAWLQKYADRYSRLEPKAQEQNQ